MPINLQAFLQNEQALLYPLTEHDFTALYDVASDPKIWEQHPNPNRWQEDQFRMFFEGALQSKGAYKIVDATTEKTIGSTRFYDYDESDQRIFIGYTFYATSHWGSGVNAMVKRTMMEYIFQFVAKVNFHVGAQNIRSQIAMSRIGATKIDEQAIAYFGEETMLNYVYQITNDEFYHKTQ
jgi:N-acetyltransferase